MGLHFVEFSLTNQVDTFAFDPGFFFVIFFFLVVFVVNQTVVDDLSEVLRHFDSGAKVPSTVKAFMFTRPDWSLCDDEEFADFPVAKLIAIAVAIPVT